MEDSGMSDQAISEAKEVVEELYNFRDQYFERNDIERASHKTVDLSEQLISVIDKLDKLEDKCQNKAVFCMIKGKALNVMPTYSADAKEYLAKAVKLEPTLVEAWNNLGECLWKNQDILGAQNCFVGALGHSKNKVSLRNVSMVLRQLGSSSEERLANIEESVEKAKEAVSLDIEDGTSWFILGNAYLSSFFAGNQNPSKLKQCLSSYSQAEKYPVAKSNPDLHRNRAMVYKYEENYQEAIDGFSKAAALDPLWDDPVNNRKNLIRDLKNISESIKNKGKVRDKKLQTMIRSLNENDLGPYKGGSYTSAKGKSITLKYVTFNDLQDEINQETIVLGKVVCTTPTDETVPFICCMVDSTGTCFAVTVYNMATNYGLKIGDSVAIPEPYVQKVDVKFEDTEIHFRSVRVDSPIVLVVNGKKLGSDKQAKTALSVTAMSE